MGEVVTLGVNFAKKNDVLVILATPILPNKHLHICDDAERAKRSFSDTGNRTRALPALYSELTLL
jgi:hypothetical protein